MATQRTMLCSVKQVKLTSSVSENIDDKYISMAIWDAQEFKLRTILGDKLLARLKALVASDTTASYPAYESLLNICSSMLCYQALANVCLNASFKITNAGVVTTAEEKVNVASMKDICIIRGEYQKYADARILDIQRYLLDNRTSFAELDTNTGHEQRPNLHTMENCGICLGGPRGKKL